MENDSENIAIIRAIKRRKSLHEPVIIDGFYNTNKPNSTAWIEVCKELYADWKNLKRSTKTECVIELQVRWDLLQCHFAGELAAQKRQKLQESQDIEPPKKRTKFQYFDEMSFLLEHEEWKKKIDEKPKAESSVQLDSGTREKKYDSDSPHFIENASPPAEESHIQPIKEENSESILGFVKSEHLNSGISDKSNDSDPLNFIKNASQLAQASHTRPINEESSENVLGRVKNESLNSGTMDENNESNSSRAIENASPPAQGSHIRQIKEESSDNVLGIVISELLNSGTSEIKNGSHTLRFIENALAKAHASCIRPKTEESSENVFGSVENEPINSGTSDNSNAREIPAQAIDIRPIKEESRENTVNKDSNDEEDEDRQFMLSLAPSFKKLKDTQKLEVRLEMLKVLLRVLLSNEEDFKLAL